jgi:hypothetical protein
LGTFDARRVGHRAGRRDGIDRPHDHGTGLAAALASRKVVARSITAIA